MSVLEDFYNKYVDPTLSLLGNVVKNPAVQGIGGGLLTTAAYNRILDIGEEARREAELLADKLYPMTQFRPYTVTSATGGQFGVTPVYGADGNILGTQVGMALSPEERALQGMLFGQSQQFLGQAGLPTAQREADVYERIRATQLPEEQRQRLALEERLANQGRLGVRTSMFGGTPEAFAMEQAQAEARNRAMLLAMQQAQAEQMQQQQLGMSALGGAYMPQAQLLNVQQAAQLYPQMQQQAQLFGTGLFGETRMSALDAQLIAEQKAADLMGAAGTGLLSAALT